ncbi:MAG: hypothetical protein QW100_01270 [Thermoplasmatales archaeon]
MESVGRFCFYNKDGTCYFVRNQPGKCSLCPNFLSFRREALSLSTSASPPVNYFDLDAFKGNGDSLQTSLA